MRIMSSGSCVKALERFLFLARTMGEKSLDWLLFLFTFDTQIVIIQFLSRGFSRRSMCEG